MCVCVCMCMCVCVCVCTCTSVSNLPLGVHEHCTVQHTDWPPKRFPLGDQRPDGSTCITEEDPIIHVNGDTEFTALLLHN